MNQKSMDIKYHVTLKGKFESSQEKFTQAAGNILFPQTLDRGDYLQFPLKDYEKKGLFAHVVNEPATIAELEFTDEVSQTDIDTFIAHT